MSDKKTVDNSYISKAILLLAVVMFLPLILDAYRGLVNSKDDFEVTYSDKCENRYFATTEDGQLFPLTPIDRPGITQAALFVWASEAVVDTMTFGFHDYRMRLQDSSQYFTRKGWESFTKALKNSRIVETVNANRQVLGTVVSGSPLLLSEGVVDGNYQWTVQVPTVVTYQSGSKARSDRFLLTLVISRSSRLENRKGIAIQQWIAVPN